MNAKHSVSDLPAVPAVSAAIHRRRSLFLTALIVQVLAVLIISAGAAGGAHAGTKNVHPLIAGETIALGKQGLFASNIPHGVSYVYLDVIPDAKLPPRFGHDTDVSYRPPALEVRFLNENGGRVDKISALVYVFFNIGKAERWLWFESGTHEISIWYVNEVDDRWVQCPTFFVNENRDNGMFDRLACLAPGSGYYVLGHVGFDTELFNPYNESGIDVVDFATDYLPF